MYIFVTGIDGFIGRHLAERLLSDGYTVRGVTRRSVMTGGAVEGVEYDHIEDIADTCDWTSLLQDIDVVVHLAAKVHDGGGRSNEDDGRYALVNTVATERLARAAAEKGVKRFIYMSTIKVNGEQTSDRPFIEDDEPNPQDEYALSKLNAELALQHIMKTIGIPVVIIRPSLVYGPNVPGNFLRLMSVVRKRVPLPLGGIDNKRSFIGVGNLVDLIKVCIEHPQATNQLFFASDGEDISTTELIRRIAACMGKRARLFHMPGKLALGCLLLAGKADLAEKLYGSLQVDSSKARTLLGWRPSISMNDELRRTVSWFEGRL